MLFLSEPRSGPCQTFMKEPLVKLVYFILTITFFEKNPCYIYIYIYVYIKCKCIYIYIYIYIKCKCIYIYIYIYIYIFGRVPNALLSTSIQR